MSKPILLSALLCAILLHKTHSSFLRTSESEGTNPAVVHVPKHGYKAVTIDKNILSVTSTFRSDKNEKDCRIIVDPFEDAIIGRVKTLTFQESIIVWGIRNVEVRDEIRIVRYTMLLVDPQYCSYKPLHLPTDEVPINLPTLEPEVAVVPHPTSGTMAFNIFFPTLRKCAPCQYYPKDGTVTKLPNQVRAPVMGPSRSFHVHSFGEMNDQIHHGYLLAYNYAIGTSRIEYLDKAFKPISSRYFDHSVDVTAVVNGKPNRQSAASCWRINQDKISCERFDSQLSSKASYHVDGNSVSIAFDKDENAYISTARKRSGANLSVYDVFGKLLDKLDVGPVTRSANNFDVNGFLDHTDRPSKEYCLALVESPASLSTNTSYSMRCVDVSKYSKAP